MLPDTDWRAEDQPGVRARTSGGNDNNKDNNDDQDGDISNWMFEKKTSREETEKSAPKKRDPKKKPAKPKENFNRARWNVKVKGDAPEEACVAIPVVTRAQAKKSDKVQRLKAKEAMSSVDKSTIEDLQTEDATLKKCFNRVEKPVSLRRMLCWKHQETKTGRSLNKIVIPKGIRQQMMSVNQESAFSGHLGAKKAEIPNVFWPELHVCQDVIRFCLSYDVIIVFETSYSN